LLRWWREVGGPGRHGYAKTSAFLGGIHRFSDGTNANLLRFYATDGDRGRALQRPKGPPQRLGGR
jgi:hypothetical protein